MKTYPTLPSARPHLHAAALLLLAFGVLMAAIEASAHWLERNAIHRLAADDSPAKNRGVALQGAAFAQPDLLPLYGSSELIRHVPDRAGDFFATYPSDFAVSPTGKPGSTTLIMLQRIAATADHARGHKVAIILSPSWFIVPEPHRRGYAGNFSVLQAGRTLFESQLSWSLKQDIARRLLDYPDTMERSTLLERTAEHVVRGDHWFLRAVRPVGFLHDAFYGAEDHIEASAVLISRWAHGKTAVRAETHVLPWDRLLAGGDRLVKTSVDELPDPRPHTFASDAEFRDVLEHAREWGDLDLLLRTLRELHLDPLIVSIPIERRHFLEMGIAPESIDAYEAKLAAMTARYRVPLIGFAEHGDDGRFFADHHDHLSAKGWLYFDKALDDFFHAPRGRFRPQRDAEAEARRQG